MSPGTGQMTGLVTKSAADYDESFDAIIDRTLGPILDFEPWRLLVMETPVPLTARAKWQDTLSGFSSGTLSSHLW